VCLLWCFGRRHAERACYFGYNRSMFELFDPKQEFTIREGNLPHWYQPGATYFVTFRTEDSVPQSLAKQWHGERDHWLGNHGINPKSGNWKAQLSADPELEKSFHVRFTKTFLEYLDRGLGECALKNREIAERVANALRYFDGERYHLGDYVIMPNHVHLLTCLMGSTEIETQCYSWKKYSACQINRLLSRKGRFWQEESFDHLVRSPEQFEYLRKYIAQNPQAAGLSEGEYLYWRCPK
jgi:putative transposase